MLVGGESTTILPFPLDHMLNVAAGSKLNNYENMITHAEIDSELCVLIATL